MERTRAYRGVYHVLGGALSPLDGVEPEHLRIDELLRRVERNGVAGGRARDEPEHDRRGDRRRSSPTACADRTRVTRLASGLPVGGDLEYADEVTLGRALAGRREM